jgi:hypothetical protein
MTHGGSNWTTMTKLKNNRSPSPHEVEGGDNVAQFVLIPVQSNSFPGQNYGFAPSQQEQKHRQFALTIETTYYLVLL